MVYVDYAKITVPQSKKPICHMAADTHKELIEMATQLGVLENERIINNTSYFEISESKRRHAILLGAKKVSVADLMSIVTKEWVPEKR